MNTKQGFGLIKIILSVVLIIVFISLLGINLEQDVVANPEVQTNFGYVVSWFSGIWENHLSSPIMYFWNDIFIDLFWEPFIEIIWSGDFVDQLDGVSGIEE